MSKQLVVAAAEEEESWINRMSRFMSVHIKENGTGILPHIPFIASQPVPASVTADQQQHKVIPEASSDPHAHFSESDNAQMTIFYGGQVIVLNLPTKKAEAIIRVASKASSSFVPASPSPTNPAAAVAIARTSGSTASEVQGNRQSLKPNVADLPIQRKASLSLFFEKRKNRINARAPYNVKGEDSSKSADGKTWLALAVPSHNSSET